MTATALRRARARPVGYPDSPVTVASKTSVPRWAAMSALSSASQESFSLCLRGEAASVSPIGERSLHLWPFLKISVEDEFVLLLRCAPTPCLPRARPGYTESLRIFYSRLTEG